MRDDLLVAFHGVGPAFARLVRHSRTYLLRVFTSGRGFDPRDACREVPE